MYCLLNRLTPVDLGNHLFVWWFSRIRPWDSSPSNHHLGNSFLSTTSNKSNYNVVIFWASFLLTECSSFFQTLHSATFCHLRYFGLYSLACIVRLWNKQEKNVFARHLPQTGMYKDVPPRKCDFCWSPGSKNNLKDKQQNHQKNCFFTKPFIKSSMSWKIPKGQISGARPSLLFL